jgi:hypothetical protein
MSKRTRDDEEANGSLSTLSVFSYHGPLTTHFVPATHSEQAMPALLAAIFGSRKQFSVFSITCNARGSFVVLDEACHRVLFGGSGATPWQCLYIHESSSRAGAEISGTLAMLCNRLARARVPVLNVCTLARNFMLVRQAAAELALATLRTAVESSSPASAAGQEPASKMEGVRVELKRTAVVIGSLAAEQAKACAHGLLHLLFLRQGAPSFAHYFEMGGEISLMIEEGSLDALHKAEPQSATSLVDALGESLTRGWRVLDVTTTSPGYDGIGILGAVCLPLASLPLMNVSTLDHTFVLLQEEHVEAALEFLAPHFDVLEEGDAL